MPYLKLPDGSYYEVAAGTPPSQAFEEAATKYPQAFGITPKQNSTQAADLGTDLKRGILSIPGAVTGLPDILVAAVTGKPMVSQGWDEIGNITGFQPSKWADEAAQRYSPERQAQDAEFDALRNDPNASGWVEAGARLSNPIAGIVGPTVQSIPSMLAGGYGGAKVLGGIASKLTPAAGRALIAGGGEGAIAAGQFRNAQTEQGVGTPYEERIKSLGALGAGIGTGLISGAGGALASKFGITDPDAIFANSMARSTNPTVVETLAKMSRPEIAAFRAAANRNIASRVGLGMVQEGLLEELPQSAQEQMWQNWVEGKPLMAGVKASAIQGGLSGALMGGAFNARKGGAKKDLEEYDEFNKAAEASAYKARDLQTKLVEDSQNAAAKAFINENIVTGQPTRQEALQTALSGLLQSEQGIQDVLKNPKNYFPDYSQEEIKAVKKDLLQLRDTLKANEKSAPIEAEKQRLATKQAELDEAFNALTPEEQAAFNEPSVMTKPEATAYTPEVLKKLGLHPKSLEFRNSVGKPIGDETAVAEITNFANRTGSAATRENITQHLDSIAQTKPVATPEQTSVAALAEKTKAGTATSAEVQQLRDLQEKINGNQVPNPAGSQPSVGVDNVGGMGAASGAGQADAGTVGLPDVPAGADVGRTESEREPLDVSQDNEYTQARQAMLEYVNNPKPATKQDALVYAMMVQKLDKSSGGTTDKQAKATADKLLSMASETELAKATQQYEKYRRADAPKTEEQLIIEQARQDKLTRLAADRQAADLQAQQEEFAGQKYNDSVIAKDAEAIIADQDKVAGTKKRQQQALADQTYHDTQSRAQQDQDIRDLMDEGVINELGDFGDVYNESKVEGIKTPETVAGLKSVISKFLNTKHWNTERLHIVQSVADVPANRRHAFNERTQAVAFTGKEAWLVADRIEQGNGKAVFLHEVGVHLGMKGLLGEGRAKNLANRIMEMTEKGTEQEKAIAQAAAARVASAKVANDPEELIAYFVEEATKQQTLPQRIKVWLKEFLAGASAALRKLNMNPETMSGDDIVMLAKGAAKVIMTADTTAQDVNGHKLDYNRSVSVEDLEARIAELDAQLTKITRPIPDTVLDKLRMTVGAPKGSLRQISDWFFNGVISSGFTFSRKETARLGSEYTLLNGKERGHFAIQRDLNNRNITAEVLTRGKLLFDQYGVPHSEDSDANALVLADGVKGLSAEMKQDGMSDDDIYEAIYKMFYSARFRAAKEGGWASTEGFTTADMDEGDRLKAQYADAWERVDDTHQEMRAQVIDAMVQSGAWTPEKAREYLDRTEYVPLLREEQEMAMNNNIRSAQGLLNGRTEYHIKGSEAQAKEPLLNIISNHKWLLTWAVHNNTANLVANSMVDTYDATNGAAGGKFVPAMKKDGSTVMFFVGGKPKYLQVVDPNEIAVFAGHPLLGMGSLRIFHAMTRVLRQGVTLMPTFHLRQLIQDPLRATFVSGNAAGYFKTLGSATNQFAHNAFEGHETPEARALRRNGVAGAVDYQDSESHFINNIMGKDKGKAQKALEFGERLAQANDLSTRAAVYSQAMNELAAKGITGRLAENEASMKAMLLINFNDRGNFKGITALMSMVPFINARIQGDFRMWQALIGKNVTGLTKAQASKMVMMRLSKLATFTMLYALARSGDDDYEEAEENTREGHFLFNVGGVPVKFPVPPELGLVKSAVEQGIRASIANENTDTTRVASAIRRAFVNVVFGPSDFMPAMLRPTLEHASNHSFFSGRNLIGQQQQAYEPNQQRNPQTSAIAIQISDVLLAGGVQASPIIIDNYIRGWFGTAGTTLLQASDVMFGDKPDADAHQMPVLSALTYNTEGPARKNDFYELWAEAARAKATLAGIQKNDTPEAVRDYIERNKAALQMYPKLNSIKAQLDAQREQINRARQAIKLGTKSPEAVNELESLIHKNEMRILKGVPKLREQMGY